MSVELLIDVEAGETRVAELHEGRLFDLKVDRGGRLLGDIFRGRIENVLPGMDAAFIDIGLDRNALIYAGDIGPAQLPGERPAHAIEQLVRKGQELTVQIARPPVGSKGARVTTHLSLPGRYVVLSTASDTVGVSRRLEDENERSRLRRIADKLRPLDHGLIVRTEAEGASEAEIAADIQHLQQSFYHINSQAQKNHHTPRRLHRDMGLMGRLVRDRVDEKIEKIVVQGEDNYLTLRSLLQEIAPAMLDRLHLHSEVQPLFAAYHIERDIALALERVVPMKRGGSLSIDETEALTAIDINTGKFTGRNRLSQTVLETNLDAVEEAARQIRLRDLAGIIVIDFIDMERTRDRIKVLNALENALSLDRAKTRIVQLSPSGLVELTRQREGQTLRQLWHRPCPYCGGDGMVQSPQSVALSVRRQIRALRAKKPTTSVSEKDSIQPVQIVMHPESACALLGEGEAAIADLEETTATRLFVQVEFSLHLEDRRLLLGEPGQFEGFGGMFKVGERFYIEAPVSLYPRDEPQFIVLQNALIKIDEIAPGLLGRDKISLAKDVTLQIDAITRWNLEAHIVKETE